MEIKEVLAELGFSEGETKVYLALLKLGSSPVSKIKEETQMHRTTIYDFLENLLNKGIINYVVKTNVKYYTAADPSKLLDFLKEKQDHLQQILPDLEKLHKFLKEEVKVEVYKGTEGLKTVMLGCIKLGQETLGMGVDDSLFKEALPIFIEQYQRLLEENNIKERILASHSAKYYFHTKQTEYRFLPPEMFSPTSIFIYGNKLHIVIWKPYLTTILIESEHLVNAYRLHFESLWVMAKKKEIVASRK